MNEASKAPKNYSNFKWVNVNDAPVRLVFLEHVASNMESPAIHRVYRQRLPLATVAPQPQLKWASSAVEVAREFFKKIEPTQNIRST